MEHFFALRGWELASVIAFAYTAIVAACIRNGLSATARLRAIGGCVAGLLLTVASAMAPYHAVLHAWLLPPALLLLGYWTSGLLFVAPMKRIEKAFAFIDRLVHVRIDLGLRSSLPDRRPRSRVVPSGRLPKVV